MDHVLQTLTETGALPLHVCRPLRPRYHAHDYAAFVIGPDGHNIEAVCQAHEA